MTFQSPCALLVAAFCCCGLVVCHINVFISQAEVMKLLGLNAELYYVRDGTINSYAMNFVVPVPAHISDLEFSWQSLAQTPLLYVMAITYNSKGALLPPQVNISEKGLVPTSIQTFRVRLPCSGIRSAEIEVNIQLNVSGRFQDDVYLNFKRNKICLRAETSPPPRNESIHVAPRELVKSSGSLYVAVFVAVGVVSFILVAVTTLYLRNKKSGNHESVHTSYTTAAYGSHQNVFLRLNTVVRPPSANSGSYATIASLHKFPFGSRRSPSPYATTQLGPHSEYAIPTYTKINPNTLYYAASQITQTSKHSHATFKEPSSNYITEQIQRLSTPRSAFKLEMLIQEGTFGKIYRGILHKDNKYDEVLIKTVSDTASTLQGSLLISEGLRLSGREDSSILPPVAVCRDDIHRPIVAYLCYAHTINLKRYLITCRTGQQCPPTTRDLVDMGAQAARGLVYLHSQRMLHKDMATRNCVIDENFRLKLTDNALSRDLYPEDYHCLGDNDNRPVKWMSIESLLHNSYTSSSDVWSFGILLWELATLAQQPLAELDPFEVGAFIRDGYRPTQPINCPDELFSVMSCCWLTSPTERPNAAQLLVFLQEFYTALGLYI